MHSGKLPTYCISSKIDNVQYFVTMKPSTKNQFYTSQNVLKSTRDDTLWNPPQRQGKGAGREGAEGKERRRGGDGGRVRRIEIAHRLVSAQRLCFFNWLRYKVIM